MLGLLVVAAALCLVPSEAKGYSPPKAEKPSLWTRAMRFLGFEKEEKVEEIAIPREEEPKVY